MPDGDQGRWLNYQELAELLGCTANAARMHAVRRKWPRRASNRIGERAHVLVPEGEIIRPRAMRAVEPCDAPCNAPVPANGREAFDAHAMLQTICETVEAAVAPLREQLDHERRRADRAELRADRTQQRLDELLARQTTDSLPRRRRWWPWRRG